MIVINIKYKPVKAKEYTLAMKYFTYTFSEGGKSGILYS